MTDLESCLSLEIYLGGSNELSANWAFWASLKVTRRKQTLFWLHKSLSKSKWWYLKVLEDHQLKSALYFLWHFPLAWLCSYHLYLLASSYSCFLNLYWIFILFLKCNLKVIFILTSFQLFKVLPISHKHDMKD